MKPITQAKLAFCTVAALTLHPVSSRADDVTDLSQQVGNLLTKFGPVPVTKSQTISHTQTICRRVIPPKLHSEVGPQPYDVCSDQTVNTTSSQTTSAILTAKNIVIQSASPVIWGSIQTVSLPGSVEVDTAITQNCIGAPSSITHSSNLQVQFTRTSSIQVQKSITHGIGSNISFDTGSLLPFKIGGQLSFTDSSTTSQTNIDQSQQSITRQHTESVTIQPGQVSLVQLRVWPVRYIIPFSTTVIFNADLSANDKDYKQFSDLFPNIQDRSVTVTGTLTADDASEGEVYEMAGQYDPSQCSALKTTSTLEHAIPAKNASLHLLKTLDLSSAGKGTAASAR